MPCHGFAKSLPWKEINRSATNSGARVTLELRDSSQTRPGYPFAFKLDAIYELSGGHMTIEYVTQSDAANTKPMRFSIGPYDPELMINWGARST